MRFYYTQGAVRESGCIFSTKCSTTKEKINFLQERNVTSIILLQEKFLQFDWLRAVVFQLNLKYLHVKITNLLWVVV